MFSRRGFFRLMAAAPALRQACGGGQFIVRSANPEDLETPLSGFSSWITPVERFFVRTHFYRPDVKLPAWRLKAGALELDMGALRKFPRAELVSLLECAGNGRGLFTPTVAGVPWRYGAVGNARWAGVRLADVLRRAGFPPAVKHILFNGADVGLGNAPDFARSIPIEKAMHADTLLAYEMNGAPLTPEHGFPLRVVAPGWAGDSWVKWLVEIEGLEREYDGFFMKTAYRHPVRPVAPGTAVDPAAMVPVTELGVKSLIANPAEGDRVGPGPVTIRGAAWSGETPVARVDVSADGGRTWQAAALGAEQARYGWRLWQLRWTPPARGEHVLMARAADARGRTQPLDAAWNPSGYLWNAVHRVRVTAAAPLPKNVRAACVGCHGEDMIAGQRLTRAQWEREVDKMVKWGAAVKPEDRAAIVDFLAGEFKP